MNGHHVCAFETLGKPQKLNHTFRSGNYAQDIVIALKPSERAFLNSPGSGGFIVFGAMN